MTHGTPVELTGSFEDPDGITNLLAVAWVREPAHISAHPLSELPTTTTTARLGANEFRFSVLDAQFQAHSDTVTITVVNAPPVADAGPDQTVECASHTLTSVRLDGTRSSDADGGPLSYSWIVGGNIVAEGPQPALALPLGTTRIQLVVSDACGGSSSDTVDVRVQDTTPPTLLGFTSAAPACLWPPNHSTVVLRPERDFEALIVDVCDQNPTIVMRDGASTQPDDGSGDGSTSNDIVVFADHACIRAERSGPDHAGRRYRLSLAARDSAGNENDPTIDILVPHPDGVQDPRCRLAREGRDKQNCDPARSAIIQRAPMAIRKLLSLWLCVGAVACAKIDIVHELEEREANEIVVLLNETQPPIASQKIPEAEGGGGNKGPRFKIAVSGGDANAAWKLLNDNNLPRKKDAGLGEVFAGGGLVPTASEEKAKMLLAVQGELARTLKSIDGILDARVHVVMPEDSVLRVKEEDKAPATASVWYKYAPGKKGEKPLSDAEVADLVARAVEKLKPENVKVIGTPSLAMLPPDMSDPAMAAAAAGGLQSVFGITVQKSDVNKLRGIVAAFIAFIVLLTAIFTVALLKRGGPPKRPTAIAPRGPPVEPPAA